MGCVQSSSTDAIGATIASKSGPDYSKMGPTRSCVQKNLLQDKYKPQGKLDQEQQEYMDDRKILYADEIAGAPLEDDGLEHYRQICEHEFEQLRNQETIFLSLALCDTEEIIIPKCHGNDADVRVLVHTPQNLDAKEGGHPGCFFIQGGCGMAGYAEIEKPTACYIAMVNKMVVFNIDYRIAPEHKQDQIVGDLVSAMKHIHQNAAKYGVNKNQLMAWSHGGAGFVMSMAMSQLALNKESSIIKLYTIICPLVPAFYLTDKVEDMTETELLGTYDSLYATKKMAIDFDAQWAKKDPVLFPTEGSDDVLKMWPPTVLINGECDIYHKAQQRFAKRLQENGRLCENITYTGCTTLWYLNIELFAKAKDFWEEIPTIIDGYLLQ